MRDGSNEVEEGLQGPNEAGFGRLGFGLVDVGFQWFSNSVLS